MKIVVVLNGVALHKKFFLSKVLPALKSVFETEVLETQSKDDAALFAARAIGQGASIIFAAWWRWHCTPGL